MTWLFVPLPLLSPARIITPFSLPAPVTASPPHLSPLRPPPGRPTEIDSVPRRWLSPSVLSTIGRRVNRPSAAAVNAPLFGTSPADGACYCLAALAGVRFVVFVGARQGGRPETGVPETRGITALSPSPPRRLCNNTAARMARAPRPASDLT